MTKTLSLTSQVKFINKKKFVKIALDKNLKTFIVHIATLKKPNTIPIHLSWISKI